MSDHIAGWAQKVNSWLAAAMVALAVAWALDLPGLLGRAFYREQMLAIVLGLAGVITFLGTSWRGERRGSPPLVDILLAGIFAASMIYVAADYRYLLVAIAMRPPEIVVLAGVIFLCVMEILRRRAGWLLFAIILVFVIYGLSAHLVPAPLTGREMTMQSLSVYLALDTSAILGLPLSVASTIVIIFILFGEILFRTGGGQFFTDLAMALVGRRKGGAAKIAVLSSAFFGSISGSAVSNVVTTGLVTIPLMRRAGVSGRDAGAIEAVASTGGQFMPPIMGAAAFLMAEFLNIDYSVIIVAALIPALLYYFAVFFQIHLMALRDDLDVVHEEIPRASVVLKDGWQFLVPFVAIIVSIFIYDMSAQRAALYAAALMVVLGLLLPYRGKRAGLREAAGAFVGAGLNTVELIAIVAGAGVVIGILNATGGGFAITLALVQLAGGHILPLLIIGGLVCIVLGMGMPTAGVYVLLAALVAPAFVEAGITPLAAHMFVLYFGMMSMITPPIALACFAAATITKESPMKTGFAATQFGWVAYVIPFIFVLSPTLLMIGSPPKIALNIITAAGGVALITIAFVGFLRARLVLWERLGFFGAGALLMLPAEAIPLGPYLTAASLVAGLVLAGAHTLRFSVPKADNDKPFRSTKI